MINFNIESTRNFLNTIKNDTSTPNEINQLVSKALDSINNQDLKKLSFFIKKIDKEYGKLSNLSPSINRIHEQLANLQISLEKSELLQKPNPKKVDFSLAVFCDIDAADYNGAINSPLQIALTKKVPFVTSKAILWGTNEEVGYKGFGSFQSNSYCNVDTILVKNQKNWRIFQQTDNNGTKGFLVFIPKDQTEGMSDKEVLKEYDFNTDGSLKEISYAELCEPTNNESSMNLFESLFTKNPIKTKSLLLSGHGGVGQPGGLTAKNYTQFLNLIKGQNCLGLTISSCCAGGESTLLNLGEERPKVNFPVIVRSIGDFPTRNDQTENNNIEVYLKELNQLLRQGSTSAHLGSMLLKTENGSQKNISNSVQVYFPASLDSPAGFQVAGEYNNSYSLTFTRMRKEQLAQHTTHPEITVDAEMLEIHPILTDCILNCEKKVPILLSQIPGRAHHSIEQLKIGDRLSLFIEKNRTFNYQNMLLAEKAFFISHLSTDEEVYSDVVLTADRNSTTCVYRKNGEPYININGNEESISEFEYFLFVKNIVDKTSPDPLAVRTQTGGQQNEKDFIEQIEFKFLKTSSDLLPENILTLTFDNFKSFLAKNKDTLTVREKQSLVVYLAQNNKNDFAKHMIQSGIVSSNSTNTQKNSVLNVCLENSNQEMTQFLLEQPDIDVTVQNPFTGKTPLHIAGENKNFEAIKSLLLKPNLNLSIKDKKGVPAYYRLITYNNQYPDLKILESVLKKGVPPNELIRDLPEQGKSLSIVSFSCKNFSHKILEQVLQAGFDVNVGNPSPLSVAILDRDIDKIKLLLKYGALANNVFIAAIFTGTPEIWDILMNQPDFNPNEFAFGGFPLEAAIRIGNKDLIKKLISLDAKVSEYISNMVTDGLDRMAQLGDLETVTTVFKYIHSQKKVLNSFYYKNFEQHIFELFYKTDPDFVAGLIEKEGVEFNPLKLQELINAASHNFPLYKNLLKQALNQLNATEAKKSDLEKRFVSLTLNGPNQKDVVLLLSNYISEASLLPKIFGSGNKDLMQSALDKGVNLNQPMVNGFLPLQLVAREFKIDPDGSLFKWLVEQGADINVIGADSLTPFGEIILKNRKELFNFCIEKGANLHMTADNSLSPLFLAVNGALNDDKEGEIYKQLVEMGADQNLPNVSDQASAFSFLAATGNKKLIDWALAKGALINPPNLNKKATPLENAALIKDDPEGVMFKYLIEKGADINLTGTKGNHILLVLLKTGKVELIKWCIENGAVLPQTDWPKAYDSAIESGKFQELKSLLEKAGIKFDPDLSPGLILKGYIFGGKSLMQDLVKLNCKPHVHVTKQSDEEQMEIWALNRIINSSDVDDFRMLLPFREFIERNLNFIKKEAENRDLDSFLDELRNHKYISYSSYY